MGYRQKILEAHLRDPLPMTHDLLPITHYLFYLDKGGGDFLKYKCDRKVGRE